MAIVEDRSGVGAGMCILSGVVPEVKDGNVAAGSQMRPMLANEETRTLPPAHQARQMMRGTPSQMALAVLTLAYQRMWTLDAQVER